MALIGRKAMALVHFNAMTPVQAVRWPSWEKHAEESLADGAIPLSGPRSPAGVSRQRLAELDREHRMTDGARRSVPGAVLQLAASARDLDGMRASPPAVADDRELRQVAPDRR